MFVLAGREDELALILAELDAVRIRRTAGSVLIRGAAGIGKSRLLAAVAETTESQGQPFILGRADSFDRGIPLGVIRDAIGGLDASGLTPQLQQQLEDLNGVLNLRHLADSPQVAATAPVRQLDQVVNLLSRLLSGLSADGTALLLLDDLHLADPESVSLYRLLARELADCPVMFVMTARPGHAALQDLETYVERLAERFHAVVIDLAPLSTEAVSDLVASTLNHPPAAELAAFIMQQSAGNPFFARELSLRLLSEQRVVVRHGRARLDGGNAAVSSLRGRSLTGRFFSATSDEGRAAAALSIFGRFHLDQVPLVADLTGLTEARVSWCCERLVQSQLLVRSTSGYEFAHPLLKSSLYHDLGDAQRSMMHARVVEQMLGRAPSAASEVDTFELATHVAASAVPGDGAALSILLTAARLAMENAPLVAAEWFARAVELMPRSDPRRPQIQSEHTYAYVIAAHSGMATETGLQALADSAPGADLAGLIFATVSAMYPNGKLSQALELMDSHLSESASELQLLALKMSMLAQLGRLHEAGLLYRGARRRPLPADPIAATTVSIHLLLFAQLSGLQPDGAEIESQIRDLLPAVPPAVRAEFLNLMALIPIRDVGSIDVAQADLEAARKLRGGITSVSAGGNAEDAALMLRWYRGQWDEAMATVTDTIDLLSDKGNHLIVSSIRGYAALILTDRGEHQRAVELIGAESWTPQAAAGLLAVARARTERHLGSPTVAAAALKIFCERALKGGSLLHYSLATEEWAITELGMGHAEVAGRIARESIEHVRPARSPFLNLCALRSLGLVTADPDAGRAALEIAEQEKLPVEIGKCLLTLNESGPAQVSELLRAHEIFTSVRAVPWLRRTNAALRRVGRAAPRRAGNADLSPTEWELIALVVQGMSNRQIAEALKYSTKTVEVYLSRLYAKTGYSSRVDLARAALQGQLAQEAHG